MKLRTPLGRRGTTLVELLATMAVTSSIMAMSGVLLGRLHERERVGRAELSAALSVSLLAEQFRADVRGATACEAAPPDDAADSVAQWSFVLPDERVARYEAQPRRLLRTELRAGQTVRRESFVVPAGSRCRLAIEAGEQSPRVVGLRFERDTAEGAVAPPRELVIEAVLGRDRRFRRQSNGEGNP